MDPAPRYRFTDAERRHGGLTTAARRTPLERSRATMRAAQARWRKPPWSTPAARWALGQALRRARGQRPRPDWVPRQCPRCGRGTTRQRGMDNAIRAVCPRCGVVQFDG